MPARAEHVVIEVCRHEVPVNDPQNLYSRNLAADSGR
jgi:hypothetical protein